MYRFILVPSNKSHWQNFNYPVSMALNILNASQRFRRSFWKGCFFVFFLFQKVSELQSFKMVFNMKAKICYWIPPFGNKYTHWYSSMLSEGLRTPNSGYSIQLSTNEIKSASVSLCLKIELWKMDYMITIYWQWDHYCCCEKSTVHLLVQVFTNQFQWRCQKIVL